MRKIISLQILSLLLVLTSNIQAQNLNTNTPSAIQPRNDSGWFLVYRSNDGLNGNSLYFGETVGTGEKITSGPPNPKYGPSYGLNFITNYQLRMFIDNNGAVQMNKSLTVKGALEATGEPAKIARLHIDPDNLSDGYSNGGIFFGGSSYSESTTGIASSNNGSYGPQNGLNFWANGSLAMAIDTNGKIGLGVDPSKITGKDSEKFKLLVKGAIKATNLQISNLDKWPDYVFDKNYTLASLHSLEKFVNTNKHLPNFPSAKQIENDNNSMSVSNIITSLLKTVEEQALYIIEMNKKVESIQQKLDVLINKE
ncbi:MAG: hypothetical protein ACQPRH_05620 [Solitalea-like symbiont of Tyrophagus putrescentiae]